MADLKTRVAELLPGALDDLAALVAIPSVSSLPAHAADLRRSADAVADLLRGAGCPEVEVVDAGGHPAVIGRYPAPEGRPTVCLYAHHDVQPAGDPSLWSVPPFETTLRDGRFYGRGAGDDKAGVIGHLLALRAFDGKPPVGVTLFIEGEEEIGSPTLPALIRDHADKLQADAYVILDAGNWEAGRPSITSTLRGLGEVIVTVRTTKTALHSGMFGGVVPDALTSLCHLLATMHDANGDVCVEGLGGADGAEIDYPEDRLRDETGLLPGVDWLGTGPAADRLWNRPAISVIAIDATPVADASNTLYPSARAKVSLRVPPGTDAAAAQDALAKHLREHAPWNVVVETELGEHGQPFTSPLDGEVAQALMSSLEEAFGVEPVKVGQGGSIPLAHEFAEAFDGRPVLVTAVLDPTSAMHAPDESVDVSDLERAALAEALLLQRLGS